MKGTMLVVLGVLGLGGVAAYFLLRKKGSSPSVVVPEQPNKTPPIPGGNTGISVLVQPIVDLKQAGFRAVQQTYMPSALTSQELWGGAKVAVEGELTKANQKLPVDKPLTYAAYRDAKGQVFLRVMQRGTQNETWYQESLLYS